MLHRIDTFESEGFRNKYSRLS